MIQMFSIWGFYYIQIASENISYLKIILNICETACYCWYSSWTYRTKFIIMKKDPCSSKHILWFSKHFSRKQQKAFYSIFTQECQRCLKLQHCKWSSWCSEKQHCSKRNTTSYCIWVVLNCWGCNSKMGHGSVLTGSHIAAKNNAKY